MRIILAFVFTFLSITPAQSQSVFDTFVFGTLVGAKDTLNGYFKFDRGISSMGQQIHYRGKDGKLPRKSYWARDFYYFESDSTFLATCDISTVTGDIYIMLPRIINGKLQLFEYAFRGGPMNLMTTEHYYFIRDELSTAKVTRKSFKKAMPFIVFDRPDLQAKIKSGELKFKDMKEIILQYNVSSGVLSNQ